MLTEMHMPQPVYTDGWPVEKPVENVENFDFSTANPPLYKAWGAYRQGVYPVV